MRPPFARLAGPLGLVLLVALAPAALPPRRADAAPARAAAHALPARLVWSRSFAGAADLPLGWATYLGGSAVDFAAGVAVDAGGNAYVTGTTDSADFPTAPGAAQPRFGGGLDAFVASYAANGRLRWATYLGGKGWDSTTGIAVDAQGNVAVTGWTMSSDFPVTPGAIQPRFSGGPLFADGFVATYDPQGRLRWATYLGRSPGDALGAIAADGQGNLYVTGGTTDPAFPITPGVAQPHLGGTDARNAFVASIDAHGQLRWATYLGGSRDDEGAGIAADRLGNIYVTGNTTSFDFPITSGADQPNHSGFDDPRDPVNDAFVASYDSSGRPRWATYLSVNRNTYGSGIAVDAQGNVDVTGASEPDAFITSYDANGRRQWSTYLRGTTGNEGHGIAVDARGDVYVTGVTFEGNFPVTPGSAQPNSGGGADDAFVASYAAHGRLRWSTYLGGNGRDEGAGIAVDGTGTVVVAGSTNSTNFPIAPGAAQSVYGGSGSTDPAVEGDAFVARLVVPTTRPAALSPSSPPPPGTPNARYFPATHHSLAGPYLAFWNRLGGIRTMGLPLSEPFTLAGERVQVTERAVLVLSGGRVRLVPLGRLLSAARVFAPVPPVANSSTLLYFPSTGHTLTGPFLTYWQTHQGSALLGPPIAEPDHEGLGDGTGRVYLVQWFVNGRLELHPEVQDVRYRVQQGRVGDEYLHRAGLL